MILSDENRSQLEQLIGYAVDGTIDDGQATELSGILSASPASRAYYLMYMSIHSGLVWKHQIPSVSSIGEQASPTPTRSVSEVPASRFRIPHSAFHISSIAAVVAFLAIGILVYSFWSGPTQVAVAGQTPAARITNLTDAQWETTFSPTSDNVLTSGQRLILQSGSAEITFNGHARVMLQGPAEFTIVDAVACRLATGRLTAHVPELAKGFKVHTPSGTMTDLGTEFGVYVDTHAQQQVSKEEEQQPGGGSQFTGKQPPITEVHVFRGQVELAQAPSEPNTILKAGEAVTISENKVQPLPAADPFKFALDKLNGKARQVLLSEDFETYDEGNQVKAIGPWIVQSGTRKGQGIHVYDARAKLAEMTNDAANPVANLSPAPAIGSRVAFIAASAENPRDSFPLLAREIDGKQLAKNCQVLVEFDFMPLGSTGIQFSVALAAEVGHTSGVELWRDADETKKVACPPYQWYRQRVLLDVADGVVRDARAERLHWLSSQGWVREATFQPPTPKLDWSTPPRYAMFGFPVVSPMTPAGNFWLDNVRIEVISE
ncbi:MAG: FecR family protein [Planctomycetes bacterium]|nr:FecR family protein [Planctomycetota bacterium]